MSPKGVDAGPTNRYLTFMDPARLRALSDSDLLARVIWHCELMCPKQGINKIAAAMLLDELEARACRAESGEANDERNSRLGVSALVIGKIARWAMS